MCIQAKTAKICKLSGIRIEADREGECWESKIIWGPKYIVTRRDRETIMSQVVVTSKEQLVMTLSLIQFKKFKFPVRQDPTSTMAIRLQCGCLNQFYILSEQQTPNITGIHFLKV